MQTALMIILFLLTSACSTVSVCDYKLLEDGWFPTSDYPEKFKTEYNEKSKWYTNRKGDFLACPEFKRRDVCGGFYELYEKNSDGSYQQGDIICIQ